MFCYSKAMTVENRSKVSTWTSMGTLEPQGDISGTATFSTSLLLHVQLWHPLLGGTAEIDAVMRSRKMLLIPQFLIFHKFFPSSVKFQLLDIIHVLKFSLTIQLRRRALFQPWNWIFPLFHSQWNISRTSDWRTDSFGRVSGIKGFTISFHN